MSALRHVVFVVALACSAGLWPTVSAAQSDPSVSAGQTGGHQGHGAGGSSAAAPGEPAREPLPPFIPPITEADRAAAFPDVKGHAVHDSELHYFVLFDQLEWQAGRGGAGATWDTTSWIGGDLNRVWFRSEGETRNRRLEHGEAQLLYGRAVARWWNVVGGIRQDVRPGPAQTWAAIGIQGLAPYWFDVEGTAYVAAGGRTQFRFESEYELLLTNRVILQPLLEVQVFGKSDPQRGIGAGLSSADAGLRVRYLIRRELAPYIGVTWNRTFFGTADLARAAGDRTGGARLTLGVRLWR